MPRHSTAQHSTASFLNNQEEGYTLLLYKFSEIGSFWWKFFCRNGLFCFIFLLSAFSGYPQTEKYFIKENFFFQPKRLEENGQVDFYFWQKKRKILQEMNMKKISFSKRKMYYEINSQIFLLGFANYESLDKLFQFQKKELSLGIGFSFFLARKNKRDKKY